MAYTTAITTTFLSDDTYDPADEYFDEDRAAWYCNHDVPDGCDGCARVRREDEMLAAMTTEQRNDYFGRYDPYGDEPF